MKCRKCGAELLDTDTFCIKCGQRADQPAVCLSCNELLREGERFCHKCGSPVESAAEDDEIPLTGQRTVDIPFEQIEQGILLEAEQVIVKRTKMEESERRNLENQNRIKAEEQERQKECEKEEAALEDEEEDEEDSGDSKMKAVTAALGIVVIAVMLSVGFILWRQNNPADTQTPGGSAGQEAGGEKEEASEGTKGRIQILAGVNVRNQPTTEGSKVLMVAKKGETYEYYELTEGGWYHIRLEDGGDGYVFSDYVEDLK